MTNLANSYNNCIKTPAMAAYVGDQQSIVDTTSPFRSVKEAIAIYGHQKADFVREDFVMLPPLDDRGETTADGGQRVDHHRHNSDSEDDDHGGGGGDYDRDYDDDNGGHAGLRHSNGFAEKLKKVEDELLETKFELKLLKKKQAQTEVAIASLNAELHKNLSKIARMEANEAANMNKHASNSSILDKESSRRARIGEEWRARDASKIIEEQATLDQVLSFGVCEGYFTNSNKVAKKKPIAPLITDIFLWKKSPKSKDKVDLAFLTPLYSSTKYLC